MATEEVEEETETEMAKEMEKNIKTIKDQIRRHLNQNTKVNNNNNPEETTEDKEMNHLHQCQVAHNQKQDNSKEKRSVS